MTHPELVKEGPKLKDLRIVKHSVGDKVKFKYESKEFIGVVKAVTLTKTKVYYDIEGKHSQKYFIEQVDEKGVERFIENLDKPTSKQVDFGYALSCLKSGYKVTRPNWLQSFVKLEKMAKDLNNEYRIIAYGNNSLVIYNITTEDILAEDWLIITE